MTRCILLHCVSPLVAQSVALTPFCRGLLIGAKRTAMLRHGNVCLTRTGNRVCIAAAEGKLPDRLLDHLVGGGEQRWWHRQAKQKLWRIDPSGLPIA